MIGLDALMRTVRDRLMTIPMFGERVFYRQAPQGTVYPYCVFSAVAATGENTRAVKKTANIVLQVSAFADDVLVALEGANLINEALDGQGTQERGGIVAEHHGWTVTTVTAEGTISTMESYENVQPIHQFGKEYRFIMEAV